MLHVHVYHTDSQSSHRLISCPQINNHLNGQLTSGERLVIPRPNGEEIENEIETSSTDESNL